jgi:DNA-binding transcriptional MerR regulator
MRIYSCGDVAELLGVHRDAVQAAIRAGAPEASLKAAGKRIFTEQDLAAIRRWFLANGRRVKEIAFEQEPVGA